MPTPSAPITLTNINTEFAPGPTQPIYLSSFYRGGSYVPSGQVTSGVDGTAISTSGYIRMGMFRSLTKTVSYTFFFPATVNEGSTFVGYIDTVGVPNQTLYWTLLHLTSQAADFATTSGSFTLSGNTGGFNVGTIVADSTTEGSQSFQIQVRTGSTSGTIVATSPTYTINDTSTTPANTPNRNWDVSYTRISSGSATATFNMASNGTVSESGLISSDGFLVPDNWYTPTTTGIGSSYWVRGTETFYSGSTRTGSATGTWLPLSSAVSWGVTRATTGLGRRNITVDISTSSGGSPIVSTSALSLYANKEI